MAGPLDPFTPGTDNTPFAGVEPGMFDNIRQQWGAFLDDPKGRAAIMSAGLALTAPPQFGDNGLSQIGRAVGAAGSSAALADTQDLKRQELESKDAMRSAGAEAKLLTADAAGARADAAGARLGTAGANLELRKQSLDNAMERSRLQSRLRLSAMYQNDVAKINKENANAKLLGQPEKPVLPFKDWVAANPALRSLGLIDEDPNAAPTEDTGVPAAADTTSKPALSAQDQQALQWANANPTDPRAARIKARLGVQ